MKTAPIALFAYNRSNHLRQTVEALLANELAAESECWIFCDGPRSEVDTPRVQDVQEYCGSVSGFRKVHVQASLVNRGLAQSIISGVTEVCRERGRVIVVEDDLVTSPFFLRYMNEALELYEQDEEVISIHGYVYPVDGPLPETFFLRGADCWGWATWRRGWALFNADGNQLLAELERRGLTRDFDLDGAYGYTEMFRQHCAGKNNSWAIRWHASAFLKDRLTLYPGRSLVENIGHDRSGTHCGNSDEFRPRLSQTPITLERQPFVENREARAAFARFLQPNRRRSWARRLRAAILPELGN